jgi:sugar phosphate isomerase/epimerase
MQRFYVNLPLRYIRDDPAYLDYFIERGIPPELGFDAGAMDGLDTAWHRSVIDRLDKAGLPRGVHFPFHEIHPGGRDPIILAATAERLGKAFELAMLYGAGHIVAHAMYHDYLYANEYERWLENSAATWRGLLRDFPGHPPLLLENVFEKEPRPLADLMRALVGLNAGICFDVGHWHFFAGGRNKQDLSRWIEVLGPWVRRLHLHDNDGSSDQHLGMGAGSIPFADLFSLLGQNGNRPGMTLEPHEEESFLRSERFIREHPRWFA